MDIPVQVWHMVEVMCRDFDEYHTIQVHITENQLEEMQKMEELSNHMGTNYPDTPDSRYIDDFLFPMEEAGSAEKSITTDEDVGFSETMTPPAPPQPSELSTAF